MYGLYGWDEDTNLLAKIQMPNTEKIQAKQGMIHIHMTIKNIRESMYMRLLLFSPGSEILEVPHDLFGRLHE